MDLNHRPFASLKRFEKWEVPHELIAPFSQQYRSKLVDGQVLVSIARTVIHGTGSHLYKSAIDQSKNLTRKTCGICTLPATPIKSQKWHPKLAAVRRSQPWLLPPAFRFQKTIRIYWIHGIPGSLSYVFDICYSKKNNVSIFWFDSSKDISRKHPQKHTNKTHKRPETPGMAMECPNVPPSTMSTVPPLGCAIPVMGHVKEFKFALGPWWQPHDSTDQESYE